MSGPDLDDLRSRVDDFKASQTPQRRQLSDGGAGFKIATDIVAGALVGSGVGWFIDSKADTSPWFTLICFAFGMAAAFRSIFRIMKKSGDASDSNGPET